MDDRVDVGRELDDADGERVLRLVLGRAREDEVGGAAQIVRKLDLARAARGNLERRLGQAVDDGDVERAGFLFRRQVELERLAGFGRLGDDLERREGDEGQLGVALRARPDASESIDRCNALDELRGEREDRVGLERRVEGSREAESAVDLGDDGLVTSLDGQDGAGSGQAARISSLCFDHALVLVRDELSSAEVG